MNNLKKSKQKVTTTKLLQNCKLDISKTTCWRQLNKMGFKYKISKKIIYLTKEHSQRRIETIKQWFLQNQKWNQTVFSNEKRFCRDGPANWETYCMTGEDNKRVTRPCEGGGVLVWLMVLPNGLVSHKIIRGKFKR